MEREAGKTRFRLRGGISGILRVAQIVKSFSKCQVDPCRLLVGQSVIDIAQAAAMP
jgi:hypothetical protein